MPHIPGPTRITSQDAPSLIDNIFLNLNNMHCYSGKLIEKVNDHLPNFLIIEKLTLELDNQDRPLKRDLKNFDEDKLVRDIEEINLEQKTENIGQINQKYTFYHENIMKVIDKNAPLKKLTKEELKRSRKPWITKGILTSIKKKILLKNIIQSNDQLTFLRYKTYRDKINHFTNVRNDATLISSK